MIYLSQADTADLSWPNVILILGLSALAIFLIVVVVASYQDWQKAKRKAAKEEDLRQLVHRYEQLAENTLDAQQRVAADVSDLRSRTTAIEQLLRTVE